MGLDIGADSLATFKHELSDCQTVVWNGPMGVFEFEKFSHGTFGVAHALADITERYVFPFNIAIDALSVNDLRQSVASFIKIPHASCLFTQL